MDLFNKAEDAGRARAEQILNQIKKDDTVIKQNEYKDRVDFTAYDGNNNILAYIEVKHRNFDLGTYPDYMLSGTKATYLLNLDKPAFYLNTFKDGSWAIWRIKPGVGEWRNSKPHSKHTVLNDKKIITNDLFLTLKEAYGSYKAI